jgi:hypothetical protein
MTRKRTLKVTGDVGAVLAVARRALEERGYTWSSTGPTSSEAREGGGEIKSRGSWRSALSLEVNGDQLLMTRTTNGLLATGVGLAGAGSGRVNTLFGKAVRAVEHALADNSLLS